jgi:V-type H+-transporting ATPase subunit A
MQRPLKAIALRCGDVYIPRGVAVPALNREKAYEFAPKNLGTLLFSLFASANQQRKL